MTAAFIAFAGFLGTACMSPLLLDEDVSMTQQSSIPNGINVNGINVNGINVNGINVNGINVNGINVNGINVNGINVNGITHHGQSLDSDQWEGFKELYRYMVECALNEGQTATLHEADGTPHQFDGALGLAPEWFDGPMSPGGERLVSACLAARGNALEQTVLISLRGGDITVTLQEKDTFTTYEGIFMGNLFADPAEISTCVVKGGGLSGRVCSESDDCGFVSLGDCANVCSDDDGDGQYDRCGPDDDVHLIHTWLNLSNRLVLGHDNAARLDEDGQAYGWGFNDTAQLTLSPCQGTTIQQPLYMSSLEGNNAEVLINEHACARKKNGELRCWGRNSSGQVGTDATPAYEVQPVKVLEDVAQVVLGRRHTCALQTDSSVDCWGSNTDGQLGINEQNVSLKALPTQLPALTSGVVSLSVSTDSLHTCATMSDGAVQCWGHNNAGQLGDGTYHTRHAPVLVSEDDQGNPFGDVTETCASRYMTCARKSDGTLWCWGGEGGFQSDRPRHYPLQVPGEPDREVAPGGLTCGKKFACVVSDRSRVWCMGKNTWGQLGRDTGGGSSAAFEPVPDLNAVSFVNAGHSHACATQTDGTMQCWGTDPGDTADPPRPQIFFPQLGIDPQILDQ